MKQLILLLDSIFKAKTHVQWRGFLIDWGDFRMAVLPFSIEANRMILVGGHLCPPCVSRSLA